jgi:hypothetical protein
MDTNWDQIRRTKFSKESPPGWPENVSGISMNGLNLLGIHTETGRLYWDGHEVLTRTKFSLATPERVLAFFAAAGTFGTFLVNVGRSAGWWH